MTDINALLDIIAALRDPKSGCPWDLAQDFASIVPHTLEEAYEVADAIERQDFTALPDELGDLLFQVIFYARLGEEQQRFDLGTIIDALADKLVRRHPHVFANQPASATQVNANWEAAKQRERDEKSRRRGDAPSLLDDVPVTLPATSRARKLQGRAARAGFDWEDAGQASAKIDEELQELRGALQSDNPQAMAHEIGDLMFSVVNVARKLDIDPEQALRAANQRFEARFRHVEQRANEGDTKIDQLPLDTLSGYWEEAKALRRDA
jgi:ATP diphosphatase